MQTDHSQYQGLSISLAQTAAEREAVFALRYRAYLANRAIPRNGSGLFKDAYDDLPSSLLIAVRNENADVVGSLRFARQTVSAARPAGGLSAPEFAVFPDVLGALMADGRSIASGARFSVMPENPRRREIALLIILAQLLTARATGCGWGIATARGSHLLLYKRLLLMKPLCEERPMPGLNYSYNLLASDIDANFDTALVQFPEGGRAFFERHCPNWDRCAAELLPALPVEATI